MSGGFEYIRPQGSPQPKETLTALAAAYDRMEYDVGLLTPDEAQLFSRLGVTPPAWQKTADQEPFYSIPVEDKVVGFVRFPSLKEGEEMPSDALVSEITALLKRKRGGVDLLIALSDWGWQAEREYYEKDPEVVPDFLLGSGYGSGINGRLRADNRSVWVRPYDKGRSVCVIEVFKWQKPENPFAWKVTINYKTSSVGLNDDIEANKGVDALFQ